MKNKKLMHIIKITKLISILNKITSILFIFFMVSFPVQAQSWTLKDAGIGIITYDADYDKVLKIQKRSGTFSLKELLETGALSGRFGPQFAAWIYGPPVSEYTDSNGIPVWNNLYVLSSPDGKIFESGIRSFYTPGFTTIGLNPAMPGKYGLDIYIVQRFTKEKRKITSIEFTITP